VGLTELVGDSDVVHSAAIDKNVLGLSFSKGTRGRTRTEPGIVLKRYQYLVRVDKSNRPRTNYVGLAPAPHATFGLHTCMQWS
jgi:hypothetical protein